jgi:hypothetical protein
MDNESIPMPESPQDGDKKTLSLNFLNESELTLDPKTALTEEDILRHFQLNQEDELEGITVSGKSKISIKNPKLVVSNVKKSYGNELTIKRRSTSKNKKDTKLSSVLNKLPNGIVYKDETGMGATTLELKTPRHSIIVDVTTPNFGQIINIANISYSLET